MRTVGGGAVTWTDRLTWRGPASTTEIVMGILLGLSSSQYFAGARPRRRLARTKK